MHLFVFLVKNKRIVILIKMS